MPFSIFPLFLAVFLTAHRLLAGGSGLNVIVVVNQNSSNSLQMGNYYCEQRGVPPQNLLRMTNWTGGNINWTRAEFTNLLLNPLLTMVASRGLTNQAQFILLSMDIPYRVTDGGSQNSTTSALFYGFKTNGTPVAGIPSCSLPDNSSNSYAFSELPFFQAKPNTAATSSFLAMMLTHTNLTEAQKILRRSALADSSFPTQAVYLAKTTDTARNVRFTGFDNAVFDSQVISNVALTRIESNSTGFTNLFGLLTGLGSFSLATNAITPGGLGDSLTSYGGYILENSGQTPALAFLTAGAAGSYGTVVEPCNYMEKFPDPLDYFYQMRGFSVAEAYYQCVRNPFQGLMVGEPLAAPYARPGNATWNSLADRAVLSGSVGLSPAFTALGGSRPIARVDLFVDGTFWTTMTNVPPTQGNKLTAVINGFSINYTVPANATLAAVASGLASAINSKVNNTQVQAFPVGDRIELQSLTVSDPGSNVTVGVSSAAGTASRLTTRLTAARPIFLDTVATGYLPVTIVNTPTNGDWLKFTFVKTNGVTLSLGVTNSVTNATIETLAQGLVNLINSNATLQSSDGLHAADFIAYPTAVTFSLYARATGWPASQIKVTLTASPNLQFAPTGQQTLSDNVMDLRPRNHLNVSSGTNLLVVNYALNTTQLADGWHQLTAVAYEGTSVETQTRVTRDVVVQNSGLAATLALSSPGPEPSLRFAVTANAGNIPRMELFSTGGSVGVATNQATVTFTVLPAALGAGVHPFYALVTGQSGQQYRTQTIWITVPLLALELAGSPPVLSWPAIIGRQYDLQATTNLMAGFQTIATISATNSVIHWPVVPAQGDGFYRVLLLSP